MKVVTINKKNNEKRIIYKLNKNEVDKFKPDVEILNYIQTIVLSDNVYGFRPGKNAVLNAKQHIGYKFTLSMDIKNFFDSISVEMVQNTSIKSYINIKTEWFHKEYLRQGYPTSPALSNIVASLVDNEILQEIKYKEIIYTRYADDLSFSSNDKDLLLQLKFKVKEIINKYGFKLNDRKTKLQYGGKDGKQTREITGVGVNNEKVVLLRTQKKKMRAANHKNYKSSHAKGLREWSQLKEAKKKRKRN